VVGAVEGAPESVRGRVGVRGLLGGGVGHSFRFPLFGVGIGEGRSLDVIRGSPSAAPDVRSEAARRLTIEMINSRAAFDKEAETL
jgi:hypothetical protein